MDHGLIRQRMLAAASRMPGVAVLDRARITDVDLSSADRVVIRISSPAGESVLRPRLLVGADGAASTVGRLGGIRPSRRRVSTLFGFVLERKSLPDPGYGHVFLGAQGPVLAYAISSTAVRVMFDVPDSPAGPAKVNACCGSLHVLPEPFRSEVSAGLERSHVVAGATYSVVAREITRGRLVLVGDAAGCCHPLTATGLTVCARDALRLRDALRDSNRDIRRALPLYSCRRRAAQRTRMVMARALYEVFCGQSPESRLMRDGLLEYWTRSQTRSARSMALLSTAEDRLRVMLMESAHVMLYSLGTRAAQTRALLGLPRLVLQAGETLWTS
jgi:2-polyprenyl-6-methoxyphenol hydroxylase-like FAD-dependent oxidoreductase